MRIKTSMENITKALDRINFEHYQDNITFNRLDQLTKNTVQLTLKCKSSKGPGHRLHINHFSKPRKGISACWHVHGNFFDAIWDLDPSAIIHAGALKMTGPQDNWQDRNIGSMIYPLMYSESCECNS